LIAVWVGDALAFCTGAEERKARNLAENGGCVLTTGRNDLDDGVDMVVEGEALRVRDEAKLRRLADAWLAKYGEDWRFTVADEKFQHDAGSALVFEVEPQRAFAFAKGDPFGQTVYRFSPRAS